MAMSDFEIQKIVDDCPPEDECRHFPDYCPCSYRELAEELLVLRRLARIVEDNELHLYPEMKQGYADWQALGITR